MFTARALPGLETLALAAFMFVSQAIFAVSTDSTGSVTSRVSKLTVISPVKLDPRIGPNIMIGQARTNPPSAKRSQAEPHLARSFVDPGLVVAVFRESSTFDPNHTEVEGYAVSRNGGRSWSAKPLLSTETLANGFWQFATDPVAAFDAAGNMLLLPLVWSPSRRASLLFTSKDGGATFATNTIPMLPGELSPDKHWLAVNNYRDAPHFGRILVAWHVTGNQLRTSYSDDLGQTWSIPIKLTSGRQVNPQPVFLPDGSCVIPYADASQNEIRVVTSPDGGQTFGTPRTVSKVVGNDDPRAFERWPVSLSATTDRMAGLVYATWESQFGTGATARKTILFSKSIDKGETWSAPVPVNDTPNKRQVFLPQIAVSPDGQHVTIVFYDRRNDPGQNNLLDFYLAESFDGGDTWEPNLRITESSSDIRKGLPGPNGELFFGDYFGLVPSLDLATPGVACWIDTRSGYPRAFTATIQRTRGATFETWRKLRWDTNDLTNPSISGQAADPDGDGIPNFAEYALGLEPNHVDSSPIQTTLDDSNTFLALAFTHPSVLADAEFGWEESSDLVRWEKTGLYPKRAAPTSDDLIGFWRKDLWIYKVDPGINKFVRLVVKQRAP